MDQGTGIEVENLNEEIVAADEELALSIET